MSQPLLTSFIGRLCDKSRVYDHPLCYSVYDHPLCYSVYDHPLCYSVYDHPLCFSVYDHPLKTAFISLGGTFEEDSFHE